MSFIDKIGGAAKWITDPKQILTAAGFVLGGPAGAGAGRAVGGMIPQSAGPVPWGALGANTDDFRSGTLEDGLQWGDVGQAGKDFVQGYSAGKVGQQVPGLQDLEGAFREGAGQIPGQIPGQSAQAALAQRPVNMPEVSPLSYSPPPQSSQGMGVIPEGPGAFPSPEILGRFPGDPGVQGPVLAAPDRALPDWTPPLRTPLPVASPDPNADPRLYSQVGANSQVGADSFRSGPSGPVSMPEVSQLSSYSPSFGRRMADRGGELLDKSGEWWGGLSPMEKIYVSTQGVQAGASLASSWGEDTGMGEEGTAYLGEMGAFSPTRRRPVRRFNEWRGA